MPEKKFTYRKKEAPKETEIPTYELESPQTEEKQKTTKARSSKREETSFQILYKNRPEEEPGYSDGKQNKGSKGFRPTYKKKNYYGEGEYVSEYRAGAGDYDWAQGSAAA